MKILDARLREQLPSYATPGSAGLDLRGKPARPASAGVGFGDEPDPVGRWEQMGPKPLETMGTLLRMPYAVRETNEGTLYEWPQFNADSSAADVSADERKLLLTIMTEDELTNALLPEYGYTGPQLGILAVARQLDVAPEEARHLGVALGLRQLDGADGDPEPGRHILGRLTVTDHRQHGLIPLLGHAQLPHLGSVKDQPK